MSLPTDCCGGGSPIPIPDSLHRAFRPAEKLCLDQIKAITPKGFLEGCAPGFDTDIRLLGMAALALQDYNSMPPCENYTFNSLPQGLCTTLAMGTQYYLAVMKQMEMSLIDISYSDNGLSITFNRVSNLGQAIASLEKPWLRMIENRKKCVIVSIGGIGLATPRFQSNLSRFIGMLGDGAYGWNIP